MPGPLVISLREEEAYKDFEGFIRLVPLSDVR